MAPTNQFSPFFAVAGLRNAFNSVMLIATRPETAANLALPTRKEKDATQAISPRTMNTCHRRDVDASAMLVGIAPKDHASQENSRTVNRTWDIPLPMPNDSAQFVHDSAFFGLSPGKQTD